MSYPRGAARALALSGEALETVRAYQAACRDMDTKSEDSARHVGELSLRMVEQLIGATVLDASDVLPLLRHGYEETVEHGKLWGELSDDWRRFFEQSSD